MKRLKWTKKGDNFYDGENDQCYCSVVRTHAALGSNSKRQFWRGEIRFFMRLDNNPIDEWKAYLKVKRTTPEAAMRACGRLARRICNG